MKLNTSIIIALVGVVIFQYFFYKKRIDSLEKHSSVERIKADFALRQSKSNEAPYDSVYAKNDTVSFYRNDTLLGRTVSTTE